MKINPGDVKLFLLVSYAYPYFSIKYRVVNAIPFLSIFLNFSLVGLFYFLASLKPRVLRKNWKKMLQIYLNILMYLIVVITLARLIMLSLMKYLLRYAIIAGILIVMIVIRLLAMLFKKFEKRINIIFIGLSILCILLSIYMGLIYYIGILAIILLIASLYMSLKDEKELKKQNIPLTILIIIAIVITMLFEGDILTFLRYNYFK